MTLTKSELVKKLLAKNTHWKKDDAVQFVELFFEEIRKALKNGEEVKLPGFGIFRILQKKARVGRNPRNGEPAMISARRVLSFKSSPKIKQKAAGRK